MDRSCGRSLTETFFGRASACDNANLTRLLKVKRPFAHPHRCAANAHGGDLAG
jgi:hypothetical protein